MVTQLRHSTKHSFNDSTEHNFKSLYNRRMFVYLYNCTQFLRIAETVWCYALTAKLLGKTHIKKKCFFSGRTTKGVGGEGVTPPTTKPLV